MNKISVMIVDDHTIVRDGLCSSFALEKRHKVVAQADSGRSALRLASLHAPECILMDVSMPELNGIETTRQLLSENPKTKVIALSMHSEKIYVMGMLNAGASAYLLKSCSFKELITAIDCVMSGEKYLSPGITSMVIKNPTGSSQQADIPRLSMLSQRETDVLKLIAKGHKNKAIADQLAISVRTVEIHRTHIKKKLDLHSVAELTKFAIAEGLTSMSL